MRLKIGLTEIALLPGWDLPRDSSKSWLGGRRQSTQQFKLATGFGLDPLVIS
jgi:outer membrane biogenesis lipoprotein LolB